MAGRLEFAPSIVRKPPSNRVARVQTRSSSRGPRGTPSRSPVTDNTTALLRRAGEDRSLLANRHAVYVTAREANPRRWSGPTRNWTPIGVVTLNPERDSVINGALVEGQDKPKRAA